MVLYCTLFRGREKFKYSSPTVDVTVAEPPSKTHDSCAIGDKGWKCAGGGGERQENKLRRRMKKPYMETDPLDILDMCSVQVNDLVDGRGKLTMEMKKNKRISYRRRREKTRHPGKEGLGDRGHPILCTEMPYIFAYHTLRYTLQVGSAWRIVGRET